MIEEIQNLKEHITEKFKNHEEIEALRHKRINELLDHYNKEIEGNEGCKTFNRMLDGRA